MWVVTRVQTTGGAFEQALADVVEAEAALCLTCRSVLEAAGALPARCPACGRVRDTLWFERVEAQALANMRQAGEDV